KNDWRPWPALAALFGVVAVFVYITRTGEVVGLLVLPLLYYIVYRIAPVNVLTVFFGVVVFYIIGVNFFNIFRRGVVKLRAEVSQELKWWRFILRPFATIFPIIYLQQGQKVTLLILGIVSLFFILMDLVRLMHKGVNLFLFKNLYMIFKEKETKKFSSMTIFLIACFLTILIFERDIAVTAIICQANFLVYSTERLKFSKRALREVWLSLLSV
ncbi:MAG: hypothetical protein ACE5QV_04210, partial [Fidelibacterota bacterium]